MCGVIGYETKRCSDADIGALMRIFEQSKIRGLHSCGYSFYNGAKIITKKFNEVSRLNASLGYLGAAWIGKPLQLIGHTRYSTSGDWKDERNNQPLHIGAYSKNEISLVFNGCIHMGLKEEYEQAYGKRYETENDGEIFCRKVLDEEDWGAFIAEGSFSFAGAFLYDGGLSVIRNRKRPLWVCWDSPSAFVASTEDILKRAEVEGKREEVEPCQAFELSI